MTAIRNISDIAGRYTPEETAARGSVRAHAKHLQLTFWQQCACVDTVTRLMRDGRSAAAAIGAAKQEAERYARPAMRRSFAAPGPQVGA